MSGVVFGRFTVWRWDLGITLAVSFSVCLDVSFVKYNWNGFLVSCCTSSSIAAFRSEALECSLTSGPVNPWLPIRLARGSYLCVRVQVCLQCGFQTNSYPFALLTCELYEETREVSYIVLIVLKLSKTIWFDIGVYRSIYQCLDCIWQQTVFCICLFAATISFFLHRKQKCALWQKCVEGCYVNMWRISIF